MEVSVIIPTYNGERKISRLLDALLQQTMSEFQLIIVVDGSKDQTISVLENYKSRFLDMVVIQQENKGRANVRNRGVREAKYEIVIFFDDDMEPMPNCVERHFNFQKTHQDSILCGYPIETPSPDKTDIQNYKAIQSIKWTAAFSENLNRISPDRVFLSAASMSIHKKTFEYLQGFDERLTDIEDQELARRAVEKKVPIYFDKANKAVHHDPITCKSYINRVRQYTHAQQHLHHLYPDRFPDRKLKSLLKKNFYRLFSFSFFPHLIDQSNLILVFPTFIRYKIYDWVIYSLGVVFPEKELN